jgi:hypothetical protein
VSIYPIFYIFLISDRLPSDIKFGQHTLAELAKDAGGHIVSETLARFRLSEDDAWKTKEKLKKIDLFLLDLDYILRAKSTISDDSKLTEYLASIFCYGSSCSLEPIFGDYISLKLAIISDRNSDRAENIFPGFISWVYNRHLKKYFGIPISDLKVIKSILLWAKDIAARKTVVPHLDKEVQRMEEGIV